MRVLDKVYSQALNRILARRGVRRSDGASKQALCVFF